MSQSWDVTLLTGGAVTYTPPTTSLVDSDAAARLSLVITHADGRTTRWGPDELDDQNVPSGLRFTTSDPGGDGDLSCELLRRVDLKGSDENLLDSIEVVGVGGEVIWEGRLAQFPRQHDDTYSVTPGAEGWVASLRDRPDAREIYVSRDLGQWGDISLTNKNTLLTGAGLVSQGISVDPDRTSGPSLKTGWQIGAWASTEKPISEGMFDTGGIPLRYLYYSWIRGYNADSASADHVWGAGLATDDTLASTDDTGTLRAPGPSQGTVTATTDARTVAYVYYYFNAAGGVGNRPYDVFWPVLAAYGTHGLTLRGTASATEAQGVYASDVIQHAVTKYAPGLTIGDIDATSTVIPHLAFTDPTTCEEIVKRANGYHLRSWGVEPPGRRFFLRAPDPDRLTWKARVDEGARLKLDGPALKATVNGVVVTFTDPAGRQSSVGPPGSMCEHTDATLADTSESNPCNQHGITRYDQLQLSDVNTLAGATSLGAIYLEEILSRPARRGEVSLTGMVEHPTAGPRPVSRIRAGDFIDLTDTNANSLGGARRIISTSYDHDSRTSTLTLDQTAYTLEALLAVLGAELIR